MRSVRCAGENKLQGDHGESSNSLETAVSTDSFGVCLMLLLSHGGMILALELVQSNANALELF